MELSKAHWSTKDGSVRLSMPINKIDVERRIVHGFATLDNLDKQGDVVPADASLRAFETFRGNIREMHDKKAVGKMVSFREDKYYDSQTQKFYNGIVVSAYVSKGAQDTWEKVLDGTLTGFSIGGVVKDSEDVYDENLGKAYQIIKEYELSELSLVDNPANQFANVFSIEKGEFGGYLAKAQVENVFWCRADDIVRMSSDSSTSCPQCDKGMSNIGFVESNDMDKASMVKGILKNVKFDEIQHGISEGTYIKSNGEYGKVMDIIFKGGARLSTSEDAIMAKSDDPVAVIKVYSQIDGTIVPTNRRVIKNISSLEKVNAISKSEIKEVSKMDSEVIVVDEVEKSVEVEAVAAAPAVEEVAKAVEPEVEKAADEEVSEPVSDSAEEDTETAKAVEPEVVKVDAVEEVTKSVNDIAVVISNLAEVVKALDAKVEGLSKSVTGAVADVANKVENVTNEFGKRVDAVERDTAFRKSADLGEILQEEPVMQKATSAWGGRFLNSADLFN
jgi:Putative phage serine protease XkdF